MIDSNTALASICSEANVMPVYAFLSGGNLEFKFACEKSRKAILLQEIICCT